MAENFLVSCQGNLWIELLSKRVNREIVENVNLSDWEDWVSISNLFIFIYNLCVNFNPLITFFQVMLFFLSWIISGSWWIWKLLQRKHAEFRIFFDLYEEKWSEAWWVWLILQAWLVCSNLLRLFYRHKLVAMKVRECVIMILILPWVFKQWLVSGYNFSHRVDTSVFVKVGENYNNFANLMSKVSVLHAHTYLGTIST